MFRTCIRPVASNERPQRVPHPVPANDNTPGVGGRVGYGKRPLVGCDDVSGSCKAVAAFAAVTLPVPGNNGVVLLRQEHIVRDYHVGVVARSVNSRPAGIEDVAANGGHALVFRS